MQSGSIALSRKRWEAKIGLEILPLLCLGNVLSACIFRTAGRCPAHTNPTILARMYQKLLTALLAFLFPDRCASCRRYGALLCDACRAQLTPYPGGLRKRPASLTDVSICYVYTGPLPAAIHQLKYHKIRRMAEPLGQLLAEYLSRQPYHIDAMIPIPLHPQRLAERGFNQAEVLAGEIVRRTGIPLISGLTRIRSTEKQARLNARQRAENVRDAFCWQASVLPPRRVLLIDDVLTTGATMAACADTLLAAGAMEIYGLALARSKPDL